MHVQAQGNGRTRLLWQKVRWGSHLHGKRWHLLWRDGDSFTIEEKPDVTDESITDDILAAVTEAPGASWTALRKHVTGNVTEAAGIRDRLLAEGLIVNTATRMGQFNLWHSNDPATDRSEAGTDLERPTFPLPDPAPKPTRSTVPALKERWNGNGTAEPGFDDADRPLVPEETRP